MGNDTLSGSGDDQRIEFPAADLSHGDATRLGQLDDVVKHWRGLYIGGDQDLADLAATRDQEFANGLTPLNLGTAKATLRGAALHPVVVDAAEPATGRPGCSTGGAWPAGRGPAGPASGGPWAATTAG